MKIKSAYVWRVKTMPKRANTIRVTNSGRSRKMVSFYKPSGWSKGYFTFNKKGGGFSSGGLYGLEIRRLKK